jgi:hypothetical protein
MHDEEIVCSASSSYSWRGTRRKIFRSVGKFWLLGPPSNVRACVRACFCSWACSTRGSGPSCLRAYPTQKSLARCNPARRLALDELRAANARVLHARPQGTRWVTAAAVWHPRVDCVLKESRRPPEGLLRRIANLREERLRPAKP